MIPALLFVVLLAAPVVAQTSNPHTSPADVEAGGRIYRSHCADCHGLAGRGGKGPDLTTGQFFHGSSDADLMRNISDGIEGTAMPGVFFSPDQVWQIVAFVRTLAQQGSAKPPPGSPVRGRQLFASRGCTGCHLVRGEGGVNGPDLSHIGSQRPAAHIRESILKPGSAVDRAFWTADILLEDNSAFKGFLLNEDTYNVQVLHPSKGLLTLPKRNFRKFDILRTSSMPSYEGQLRAPEIDDIVAYLWSLQRPRRMP